MKSFKEHLHPSWQNALSAELSLLDVIEESLSQETYSPEHSMVMRAFNTDLSSVRVVIFGQDPYPDPALTTGLAFAIPLNSVKVPPSLKNILREAQDDIGINGSRERDLAIWVDQGVLLLNRTLTIGNQTSNSHKDMGWASFTHRVAEVLAQRGVVAVLWGKSAQELSALFPESHRIEGVHPSPLSAHRGFFGSKPFSKVNAILERHGYAAIHW